MNRVLTIGIAIFATLGIGLAARAQSVSAKKPCEELKADIEAKLQAKGVKNYTLSIAPLSESGPGAGVVVGTCDGHTQQIVYQRGGAAAKGAALPM